jgi:hypothetical protein
MNIEEKKFLSYSSTIATPCLRPMNQEIKQRLLNIGSNMKDKTFSFLFSSYFRMNETKKSKNTYTSFFI